MALAARLGALFLSVAFVDALVPAAAQAQAQSRANSQANSQAQFNISAGRLSSSIRKVARQAGISVASRESGLRRVRVKAVRGRLTPAEALRRLLVGTPYRAVAITGGFRIEKAPAPSPRRARGTSGQAQPVAPPPAPAPIVPIVVEGTKRALGVSDYPGGVKVLLLDDPAARGAGVRLDTVLADAPGVTGTALGSGRNKIFLRGIADSSFNGPTQSTIGLYLGEQRLIFSAPNPDLRLYDAETIEVLEGPQGTLYGAGTIAGLVRINPRAPDPSGVEAQGWSAAGVTRSGGVNWDAGAVLNTPVAENAAVRLVGYGGQDSGYIDDAGRQIEDINSAMHYGGRAAFAMGLGADWGVSLSGFGQHSETRDGQYTDASFDGLARVSRLTQPFRGRIYGGALTVRGAVGVFELISTTGMVDHGLRSVFDSSTLLDKADIDALDGAGPIGGAPIDTGGQTGLRQAFRETREIRLLNHETRLSGGDPDGLSGLIGVSALRNRDRMRQIITNLDLGAGPAPPFANLTYLRDEIALFGEGSYALDPAWTLTGGARLLYTSASGERSFGPDTIIEPRNGPTRLLPSAALAWEPADRWMVYVRAQEGFRTGGVTIERDAQNDPQVAQFDDDEVRSVEAGVRARLGDRVPVEVSLTAHRSIWRNIQADLLDRNGFPITRNIGDGRILGADASVRIRAPGGWDLSLLAAVNDTKADRLVPGGGVRASTLPNVPDVSALARVAKLWTLNEQSKAGVSLTGRYTGRSFLDLDQSQRVEQGDFGSIDAGLWWEGDRWGVRLEAFNLTNTRGNRFAFGNPFTVRAEDQETPLRPFTMRLQVMVRR